MLTKAEALSVTQNWRVFPDKLTTDKHGHYVGYAAEMLRIYRDGTGTTREELHETVEQLFWTETDCPPRRVAAFCKLLDDRVDFEGADGDEAAKLRMRVFGLAAAKYPLVRQPASLLETREADVKSEIAAELGRPWPDIERELFGDVIALHRLGSFTDYDSPEALLSRYNEAQIQAALYDATEMRVFARDDYKPIMRAAKLSHLMYSVVRRDEGFEFTFNGPASLLRETQRYGILMAHEIPTLLLCSNWEMRATIRKFRGTARQPQLIVSSSNRYRSSLKALPEFDSGLERKFSEKWGPLPREGWGLKRESEPRFIGQKAFFPDFTFTHETGVKVLFEIIGHWTREYLAAKKKTLEEFKEERLLLAVKENSAEEFDDLGMTVVPFKSSIKLDPVIAALRAFLPGT